MATNTTKMGLRVWNDPSDHFVYTELANNWSLIDAHNHDGANSQALAANSVGATQIVSNAVTNPKIQDNAVTTTKIQDAAVTSAKLNFGPARYTQGALAARPAQPYTAGAYYYATDTFTLYLSDGTAWQQINVSPPRASLYSSQGSSGQAITTGVDTAVTWTARALGGGTGTVGFTVTGTTDITPSVDGNYSVAISVVWKTALGSWTAGTYRDMRLERTTIDSTIGYNPIHLERSDAPPSATVTNNRILTGIARLVAGQSYRVMVRHDAGSTINLQGPSVSDINRTYEYYTNLYMVWISPT